MIILKYGSNSTLYNPVWLTGSVTLKPRVLKAYSIPSAAVFTGPAVDATRIIFTRIVLITFLNIFICPPCITPPIFFIVTWNISLCNTIRLIEIDIAAFEPRKLIVNRGDCISTCYVRVDFLEEVMLQEVYQAERLDGVNMQSLTVQYNCVGYVEIPNSSKLPELEIIVNTRQVVVTRHVPAKTA